MNKKPPNIVFKKKEKGGISFSSAVKEPKVDLEAARAICAEYRINNAEIFMSEDYEIDDLVRPTPPQPPLCIIQRHQCLT